MSAVDWPLDEHVVVRALTAGDADAVYALIDVNRAHLRPWMPWEPMTKSAADTRAYIESSRAAEHDLDANGIWLDGVLAGAIGMRIDPMNDVGEIGYWLGASFEGRGLMTRSARRFVAYGFGERGLHRIEIRAAPENTRSRAVAERLGFHREAVLREASRTVGGYLDLVVYAMLADEWPGA